MLAFNCDYCVKHGKCKKEKTIDGLLYLKKITDKENCFVHIDTLKEIKKIKNRTRKKRRK